MSGDFEYVEDSFKGYKLTSGIIETGNSVVYESNHPTKCTKLAVKFIKKTGASEQQYQNEVALNREIDCEYIMPVEDIITDVPDDFYCAIVMKKATGCDLLDMLLNNKGPLPEKVAVQVAYAGLKALKYLHENGIVHRDIKMENFFLMDGNYTELDIVLADFGHACRIQPGVKMNTFSIGTLEYSAPEILNKIEYDESVDIWSFGCLMYSILAYRTPFGQPKNHKANSIAEFIQKVSEEPDYSEYPWDQISPDAIDFVQSMLQIDPEERPSIDELLEHAWFTHYTADYGRQKDRQERSKAGIVSKDEVYDDSIQDAG